MRSSAFLLTTIVIGLVACDAKVDRAGTNSATEAPATTDTKGKEEQERQKVRAANDPAATPLALATVQTTPGRPAAQPAASGAFEGAPTMPPGVAYGDHGATPRPSPIAAPQKNGYAQSVLPPPEKAEQKNAIDKTANADFMAGARGGPTGQAVPGIMGPRQGLANRPADNDAQPVAAPVVALDRNARYATTYRPGGAAIAAFDAAVVASFRAAKVKAPKDARRVIGMEKHGQYRLGVTVFVV